MPNPIQEMCPAPLQVAGVEYFASGDVARAAGVSRQTLWRWRQEGKIPAGRRYRDRRVLFNRRELDLILQYAHRLEPLEVQGDLDGQLDLFSKGDWRS